MLPISPAHQPRHIIGYAANLPDALAVARRAIVCPPGYDVTVWRAGDAGGADGWHYRIIPSGD
jgi:hypothetical protein